jgi:hypothetical protein
LVQPHEVPRYDALIATEHYLKNARGVGEQLRYVAEYQGPWLVLLGGSAPAFHLQARVTPGWGGRRRNAAPATISWPKTAAA